MRTRYMGTAASLRCPPPPLPDYCPPPSPPDSTPNLVNGHSLQLWMRLPVLI